MRFRILQNIGTLYNVNCYFYYLAVVSNKQVSFDNAKDDMAFDALQVSRCFAKFDKEPEPPNETWNRQENVKVLVWFPSICNAKL